MKIPNGHQAVMPYLILDDAKGFIAFIKEVFGAEMTEETYDDNGVPNHCEANIGGSTIMFSNSRDEWGAANANLFVYVEDADEVFSKALANGGESIREVSDLPYGRSGGVRDPNGNVWWITSVPE